MTRAQSGSICSPRHPAFTHPGHAENVATLVGCPLFARHLLILFLCKVDCGRLQAGHPTVVVCGTSPKGPFQELFTPLTFSKDLAFWVERCGSPQLLEMILGK